MLPYRRLKTLVLRRWLAITVLASCCPHNAVAQPDPSLLQLSLEELMNIVVVRKKEERLIDVPVAVSNFSEQMLDDYNIQSFYDYAHKTPNLSFAYGNGLTAGNPATGWSSARSVALRGISGARTSGFYIGDIPIPGAVDVRLLDIKSIDIAKGPQGTLYGESSLGGNIRLNVQAPNLTESSLSYRLAGGQTQDAGALNSNFSAVGNLLLAPDTAALRLSLQVEDSGGYLTRTYRSDLNNPQSAAIVVNNQGAQRNIAGTLTGLLQATPELSIRLRLMYQNEFISGFPAAPAPLPEFKPHYQLDHIANVQPTVQDSWSLPSIKLSYSGSGWALTSLTSQFNRHTRDLEDSTEGTLQISPGTPLQPFGWQSRFNSDQLAHETRIDFDRVDGLGGTLGVFYSQLNTSYRIPPTFDQVSSPPVLLWQQHDRNTQQNRAIFGEVYYQLADRWTLTLGDRLYWLQEHDNQTVLGDAGNTTYVDDAASHGHSPKLALSYHPSSLSMLYGSATQGFRQGNAQLNPSAFASCGASLAAIHETADHLKQIKPDSLWTYELGGKLELTEPGMVITAAAFHTDWRDMQQQLLLQSCGLFIQGNAGNSRIDGAELEAYGHISANLKLRLSLGYEDTRITKTGNTGQTLGSRIYQTPQWTAALGGIYSRPLGGKFTGLLAVDMSYTGASISANNGPLNLVRAGYSLVNLRAGVSWDTSELSLNLNNLGSARPNLGDITYIGYGLFTDSSRTTPIPQVATLPPRSLMFQYEVKF